MSFHGRCSPQGIGERCERKKLQNDAANLLGLAGHCYFGARGVINGKAGKAAALSKFSDTLTLSQPWGQIMPTHWHCLPKKIP